MLLALVHEDVEDMAGGRTQYICKTIQACNQASHGNIEKVLGR